jgi:hypothetical protein
MEMDAIRILRLLAVYYDRTPIHFIDEKEKLLDRNVVALCKSAKRSDDDEGF